MRQTKGSKIFYGWYITTMSFITNFMSVGTGFYIFNAFMQPLCSEHGWTRTDISGALMIGGFIGLFGQFVNGTLVIRFGARILMLWGSFLAGIAFIQLGRVESLWLFYLFCILLYLGNGSYGGIVAHTVVNNWFILKRGKALGLATAGISLSGAIIPFLALLLLERISLESAFLWIGLVIVAIGPVAWLVVRNRPEDHGLLPDGLEPATEADPQDNINLTQTTARSKKGIAKETSKDAGSLIWTTAKMIRVQAFWKVGFAFAMVMLGVVGVMSQLKPHFSDIGFDDRTAMAMMAATALMGAFGKYVWGIFCDRFDPRRVVTVLMTACSLGLCFSLFENSIPALVLFIIIFGFAMGGVMATFPILIAYLFGRESFAQVGRFLWLFLLLQMPGYLVASLSFDLTGSYNTAYSIFIALYIAAALLILSVKRPILRNPYTIS
ncbi:MAG: MFS transporter [Deltaproteobacteria bacterium]|nr:MFS transporter [Deltaproteobacteria bacterium]